MENPVKVALYGGTFNPPHIGHIKAFECFCKEIKPDVVWVMPSSIPPHKEISVGDVPCHRYNMARLAFSEIFENTKISALELSRKGKSYSIDTVDELLCLYGCEKIYMYIGSDMLFYFEKWKDFEKLFEKCVIVTAARCEEDKDTLIKVCESYREKYFCEYIILPLIPVDISSTDLRENEESRNKYLTEEIRSYIIKNDLYGKKDDTGDITSEKDLSEIRKKLPLFVDEKRLEHIISVEKTAILMAEKFLPLYGYGCEYLADISAASLLHDITKNKDDKWHEEYLDKRMAKEEYFSHRAVYHSWSGAYFALENFFVNPRVFRAVYNHTTAGADMDIFEKIIYLADFIEPTRKYESCVLLREKFKALCENAASDEELKKALDTIILDSLEGTLSHLQSEKRAVCPALFAAKDYLDKKLRKDDKID